jgi:hypothetical protein
MVVAWYLRTLFCLVAAGAAAAARLLSRLLAHCLLLCSHPKGENPFCNVLLLVQLCAPVAADIFILRPWHDSNIDQSRIDSIYRKSAVSVAMLFSAEYFARNGLNHVRGFFCHRTGIFRAECVTVATPYCSAEAMNTSENWH